MVEGMEVGQQLELDLGRLEQAMYSYSIAHDLNKSDKRILMGLRAAMALADKMQQPEQQLEETKSVTFSFYVWQGAGKLGRGSGALQDTAPGVWGWEPAAGCGDHLQQHGSDPATAYALAENIVQHQLCFNNNDRGRTSAASSTTLPNSRECEMIVWTDIEKYKFNEDDASDKIW